MNHHRIVGFINLFMPHLFKNFICAEHLSGIGCQKMQDIKFYGRKFDTFPVHKHLMGFPVNDQVSQFDHLRLFFLFPCRIQIPVTAKLGFYSGHKLQRIKGFRHIIVRAGGQSHDFVQILGFGADHNHGNIIFLTNPPAHLQSVDLRHHNIQQHQINLLLLHHSKSCMGIICFQDTESVADQIQFQQIRDLLFIIYNQNICLFHLFKFPPSAEIAYAQVQ